MGEIEAQLMTFIGRDTADQPSVCIALKHATIVELGGVLVPGQAMSKAQALELAGILVGLAGEID